MIVTQTRRAVANMIIARQATMPNASLIETPIFPVSSVASHLRTKFD